MSKAKNEYRENVLKIVADFRSVSPLLVEKFIKARKAAIKRHETRLDLGLPLEWDACIAQAQKKGIPEDRLALKLVQDFGTMTYPSTRN